MWVYDLKKLRVNDFMELNLLKANFKKIEVLEEDIQNSSEQFHEEDVYPIMRIQQETRDAIRNMELKVMKLKNELKRDMKLMDERTFGFKKEFLENVRGNEKWEVQEIKLEHIQ